MNYDIIVVGAGHAGCEAAHAAAQLGSKVLLITMDMNKIAQMSCNPSIGGVAKGQIVREIDALGGMTGLITDKTTIQFRMLNSSKGPAMWSPRAQCDREKFSNEWRFVLEQNKNIEFWQDTVNEIIIDNNKIVGVKTILGVEIYSKAVVLTTGTFLNGLMFIGSVQIKGGRAAEPTSTGITEQLSNCGFRIGRMKTGTPVRIDGRSIDYSKLIEQKGDGNKQKFSYLKESKTELNQLSCYIAYTNNEVHNTLKLGLPFSPLYDGTIQGVGPRYCPSIETKLVTFSEKEQHQLFLEPEGENTIEYYLNGFSSSLPLEVQYEALRKIEGFESVKIFRPGYAIEYDYFDPTQLNSTLETNLVENLYFAGQINGTTGYEEAAAQGLISGINAHNKINNLNEFTLARDEAYIGVLIDDLITKGVDEPYRMFTSRAEYRILLRQDNADFRLTQRGFDLGLVSKIRYQEFLIKQLKVEELIRFLAKTNISPTQINPLLIKLDTSVISQNVKLLTILMRPQVEIEDILPFVDVELINNCEIIEEVLEQVEILIKYKGYIDREKQIADKIKRLEDVQIKNLEFSSINSLSTEARQKLAKIQPKTIGQASRISGVSPSDINVLLIYLGR